MLRCWFDNSLLVLVWLMTLVGCDFLIVLLYLFVFLLMIIMHCFDFVCEFACLFWVFCFLLFGF